MSTKTVPVELLPCPFCGGENTLTHENTFWTGQSNSVASVEVRHWCESKEFNRMIAMVGKTHVEATARWNRRAAPAVDQPTDLDRLARAELERKAATYDAMIQAMTSHVDGRDLLAELNLMVAHHTDIIVRINGEDRYYEGDWLKALLYARDSHPERPELVRVKEEKS